MKSRLHGKCPHSVIAKGLSLLCYLPDQPMVGGLDHFFLMVFLLKPKLHPFKVGKTVKKVIFTAFVCCFELPTYGPRPDI